MTSTTPTITERTRQGACTIKSDQLGRLLAQTVGWDSLTEFSEASGLDVREGSYWTGSLITDVGMDEYGTVTVEYDTFYNEPVTSDDA